MSESEKEKSPDECVNNGEWEVDPIYYSVGRSCKEWRGKVFRSRSTTDVECFESHDGVLYKPGDTVFIEANPQDSFVIGTISSFKSTKRDVLVTVTRFYRPEDVPEDSLSIMGQERGEGGESVAKPREIFSSDNQSTHSISMLRGHCEVHHVKDIVESRQLDLTRESSFFTCVVYNQESTRLASHNGEIRVGPSHQAKLPAEASCSVADEPDRDELLWRPGQISEEDEQKYVKLARTFRLCLLEGGNIHDSERSYRCTDQLLDDAITTLHRCSYSYPDALKEMNANDQLLSTDANFMSIEDTKKFGKGIKTLGKNFTRISRELLPLHSREQLVAFYYLWKKSIDAIKPKALNNRSRAAAGLRRGKKDNQSKNSRPPSRELLDYASASETEIENLDENKRQQYACHHCYGTESRDWHHAGKEHPMLLCTDCRLHYKKYGQMRSVEKPAEVPACLFKRSSSETDQEEEAGVRTRAGKKENGRKRSPSLEGGGEGSMNGEENDKKKRLSNGKRKKSVGGGGGERNGKRRKEDSIKEEEEADDDKKSSSISPSPEGDSKDVKQEEMEEEKEEKREEKENGVNGETKMEEEEEREGGEGVASTSGAMSNGEKEEGGGEERVLPSDETESGEECDEPLKDLSNYQCSAFSLAFKRGNGNSCARTDVVFRLLAEKVARRKQLTEQERKKLAPPPPPPVACQPGPSNAGIVHPMPRLPPGIQQLQHVQQQQPGAQPDMTALFHQMARQQAMGGLMAAAAHAPPGFAHFDPRMQMMMNPQIAQMMAEQSQMAAKMQGQQRDFESMLRQQQQQQAAAAARGGFPGAHLMNGMNGAAMGGGGAMNGLQLNGMNAALAAALHNGAAGGGGGGGGHDAAMAMARQQHQAHAAAQMQQAALMAAQMGQAVAAPQMAAAPQHPQQAEMETLMRMHQDMIQAMANQHAAAAAAAAAPPPPPPPPPPPQPVAAPPPPGMPDLAGLQQLLSGGRDAGVLALYQQMMGGGMNGLANGNALQSDMMRRLQHDSFKQ